MKKFFIGKKKDLEMKTEIIIKFMNFSNNNYSHRWIIMIIMVNLNIYSEKISPEAKSLYCKTANYCLSPLV